MNKNLSNNPLALAVLVLLYERPMHPYEMASTLRERRKEASIRLSYGSLYTIVEQLTRDRLITAKETERAGRRPERTVYTLTESGETAMTERMRKLIGEPAKEFPRFEAALSLLGVLPPEEAIELLEIRIAGLEQNLAAARQEAEAAKKMKLPRLFTLESEYYFETTEAELAFCKNLLADLRRDKGGLRSQWALVRKTLLLQKKGRS